jgi:hypothetical protein
MVTLMCTAHIKQVRDCSVHEISSCETSVNVTFGAYGLLQSTQGGNGRWALDYARCKRHDEVGLRRNSVTICDS